MKVLKTLTILIIFSISNIVKSKAGKNRINLKIRGTPKCFNPFSLDRKLLYIKVNVTASIGDSTHPYPYRNVTGRCDEKIIIEGNFPIDVIDEKKAHYVAYSYSHQVVTIVKRFPKECKLRKDKESDYICDFEKLDPNKEEGMSDDEFGKLLHDLFSHSKLIGG
uniref:ZP domain-containing protein n=1 Tax=Strongyloides papillosus TaxID=174720 RepID=A0A0N5CFQ3_STREA